MRTQQSVGKARSIAFIGIMFILVQISSAIVLMDVQAQTQESVLNEFDVPYINTQIQGAQYTWKVVRTMGIFATQNIHSGDLIKYRVREAKENASTYLVDVFYDNWTTKDFVQKQEPENSSMFIIPRDWSKFVIEEIIPNLAPYFCRHPLMIELYRKNFPGILAEDKTGQELLNEFNQDPNFWEKNLGKDIYEFTVFTLNKYDYTKFKYNTIWYRSRLITTMEISIELDKNNYERLVYTRAEGVLLSRKTNILIFNGTRKDYQGLTRDFPFAISGNLDIELFDFDTEFAVSFWHYVVWFLIIMGIIFASIIAISVILRMRERKFATMDY